MPPILHGDLLCLKAEDHYLRIFSDRGESLVLAGLGATVASLPVDEGMLTHRSYWVAKSGIARTFRKGRRQFFELTNGFTVPISRSRLPVLRQAGWLSMGEQTTLPRRTMTRWLSSAISPIRSIAVTAALCIFLGMVGGASLMHLNSTNTAREAHTLSPDNIAFAAGWQEYLRDTPESFIRAVKHFENAIIINPDLGAAYGALASLYHSAAVRGWNQQWGQKLHETYRLAHKNLLIAAKYPSAIGHAAEAQALLYRYRFEEAIVEASRAIAMEPNNPAGHLWMANSLIIAGLPNQAVGFLDHAKTLGHPASPSTLWARGMAAFIDRDFEAAAGYFEQCITKSPAMNPMPLVAAYGHLKRHEEARKIIETVKATRTKTNPLNLATVMDGMIFRQREDANRFKKGLRLAGL